MSALSIFEKHLGKQEIHTSKLTRNITDTNQLIGILQTLNKCLKQCLEELNHHEKVKELIKNCTFMGENLFEREFALPNTNRHFYIDDLSSLIEINSKEDITSFIQDKQQEISIILDEIFASLDQEDDLDSHYNLGSHKYSTLSLA
ncbi:flagellar FLiS export co-chaperone [Helicobacter pametensis]|uniref:flagellar FLiS export co-chaperone n=1 Tax=Helicobacter pametensis TaxID=95149 RepID=UPI0004866B4D|nr:flagellar FLiS export co-chaperone [Helicobacter pametensis]